MPGFTHLQVAQPVTLGHHLMAYYEMLRARPIALRRCPRADERMPARRGRARRHRLSRSTAHATAEALGFDGPTANSLDSVSDRDFALDYLSAAAQCALHLSRLAEEFVIWASAAVRLRPAVRPIVDRLVDHAAEAQSRRRRAGARP